MRIAREYLAVFVTAVLFAALLFATMIAATEFESLAYAVGVICLWAAVRGGVEETIHAIMDFIHRPVRALIC